MLLLLPARIALAIVTSVATVTGDYTCAARLASEQPLVASVSIPIPVVDGVQTEVLDIEGAALTRTTELTTRSSEIAKANADILAAQKAAELAAQQAAELAAQEAAALAAQQAAEQAAKLAAAKAAGYDPATTNPREIARQMMAAKYSWGDDQFTCFDKIITQESEWKVNATNPSSGAYGIPQSLPGNKMASAGDDWKTNPATQIKWALGYVQSRYGTPCSAWSFKSSHGWY